MKFEIKKETFWFHCHWFSNCLHCQMLSIIKKMSFECRFHRWLLYIDKSKIDSVFYAWFTFRDKNFVFLLKVFRHCYRSMFHFKNLFDQIEKKNWVLYLQKTCCRYQKKQIRWIKKKKCNYEDFLKFTSFYFI